MTTQVTISLASSVTYVDFYPYEYTPTSTRLVVPKAVRATLVAGFGTATFDDTYAAGVPGWRAVEMKASGSRVGKIRQVIIPAGVTTAYAALAEVASQTLQPPPSDGTKQPLDADLTALAAMSATDVFAYRNALGWQQGSVTSFARTVLDDIDAATMRATLGIAGLRTVVLSANSAAVDSNSYDLAVIEGSGWGAGTKNITITGSPVEGQFLEIKIRDSGTSRALTYGGNIKPGGHLLPDRSANLAIRLGFRYDATAGITAWVLTYSSPSFGIRMVSPDNTLSWQTANNSDAITGVSGT